MKIKLSLIAAAMALTAGSAMAQTQGVSKNELVLGSIQDLSGPLAGFGKQVRLGIQAPKETKIHREEVYKAIQDQNTEASQADLSSIADLANELNKK